MNRREQIKPENQCRAAGCNGEIFFKPMQGDPGSERRQNGNRSPLNPLNAGFPTPNQQIRVFPEGSRIVSAFCRKHTCSLFLTDDGCTYKKPIHDTVCALHTKCPIPGCTRAKSQDLDTNSDPAAPPKYIRQDFCPEHKCIIPKCPRRRVLYQAPGQPPNTQQGRFLTVCQQHHCRAEGCLEQSQEGRNSCREHECKAQDCRTIVEGAYPFCSIHIKCAVAGCAKARHLPRGGKDYLPGCELHATCVVVGCSKLRILGSIYCLSHTCQERGCDEFVVVGVYCKTHQCEYDSCRGAKSWHEDRTRGTYCSQHTCRKEKCSASVGSLTLFCKTHQCSEDRCLAKVLDEQLCIDHFKALYIAKGRGEANSGPDRVQRQLNSHPAENFTHRKSDWRHGTTSRIRIDPDAGKLQPDCRATVSSHADSDYDDDEKQSVITRLSRTDEDGEQW